MTPYAQAVAAVERGDLRAVDALVAEHALKLAVGWLNGGPVMFRYVADAKEGEVATAVSESLPRYSTDIAAAFEIVPRVPDSFFALDCELGKWACAFHPRRVPGLEGFIETESAPLAICLAALKAVGG